MSLWVGLHSLAQSCNIVEQICSQLWKPAKTSSSISDGQTELLVITLLCKASHTTNSHHHMLNTYDLLEALFLRNKLNSAEIHMQRNF